MGQMLCNHGPPPGSIPGYLHVQYGGRRRGRSANQPPPPPQYLHTRDTQHSCKETSPPLLHTTTINNTTTLHNNIKLPMYLLFIWLLNLMVLRRATSLLGTSQLFWAQMALASLMLFQGPKKSRFSGPTPSNAPHNDVARLKTISSIQTFFTVL